MNSSTPLRSKVKAKPTITAFDSPPGEPILVSVVDGRRHSEYWAERIPSDWGVAVRFRKIWDGRSNDFADDVYYVLLDTVSHVHSCECKGFLRWNHCRHVDAAIQLFDAGRLVFPPRPEHAEERPAKMPAVYNDEVPF